MLGDFTFWVDIHYFNPAARSFITVTESISQTQLVNQIRHIGGNTRLDLIFKPSDKSAISNADVTSLLSDYQIIHCSILERLERPAHWPIKHLISRFQAISAFIPSWQM